MFLAYLILSLLQALQGLQGMKNLANVKIGFLGDSLYVGNLINTNLPALRLFGILA